VTKRLSHDLDVTYSFTWSKELQLGVESDIGGWAGEINDVFNRNTTKTFSSFSRPLSNVLALNYTSPKVKVHRYANYLLSEYRQRDEVHPGCGNRAAARCLPG
jgi:hypothetical protein